MGNMEIARVNSTKELLFQLQQSQTEFITRDMDWRAVSHLDARYRIVNYWYDDRAKKIRLCILRTGKVCTGSDDTYSVLEFIDFDRLFRKGFTILDKKKLGANKETSKLLQ
jgi:hypothetical protein